jgi:hypothetical protein
MKQRIKVVADQNVTEDGQPARAWLQYDPEAATTVKECKRAFAQQLGLANPDELELYVDGTHSRHCITYSISDLLKQ